MTSPLAGRLRRYAARAARAVQSERTAFWRSRPVRPDTVLYESFAGNGMLCNPEAIFRHLVDHPDFASLHHVWALSDVAAIRSFTEEFGRHPRVSYVQRGSGAYRQALATSGYLINNATFPPEFGKRAGQIYLNTWHGTPLKQMGFDMPDGAFESANTLRNFLNADYLLAANPFMATTMYENAYRLTNVFPGRIIEEGYPRIDRQSSHDPDVARARQTLRDSGVDPGDGRIVIYAPTWRGSSFSDPDDDVTALARHVARLQSGLGDGFRVLLKTHQVIHALAGGRPELRALLVPNTMPTNVVLGVADGLVTDYSSIFFDYLATGRPVAFFTPDADDYAEDRGTYMPLDELPGPVSVDAVEAGRALRALVDGDPHPHYRQWQDRFVPFDDGHATARVVDIVFRGRSDGYRVRPARTDGRRRLLLFIGGMRSNGITTAALNLLGAIDHERYDVTALMPLFRSVGPRGNQRLIHPAVRQVFRIGGMNGSKLMHLRRRVDDWRGAPLRPHVMPWHSDLWDQEWTRVLGGARFDWVADFSGYSPFWSNLLLHSPDAPRAVWLHNEMAADRNRTVHGRQPLRRNLSLVFALYSSFDRLVSVSPSLTALNRTELADYAPAERFSTVRNLPNVARVSTGLAEPIEHAVAVADEPLPAWVEAMADTTRTSRWFVSVGRLSPEKNQARLIRAFAQVHRAHPDTRLLIVGGGPLAASLREQIAASNLDDAAFLAGAQRNPYALMHAADCFVLSSRYEGQPMVLLEAALCDLPIVSTSFASITDALPNDTIHVVAQTDEALRDGMLAFLDGRVAQSHLDIPVYVRDVLAEVEEIIGAAT